jgi:hypothetical protein
MNMGLGACGGKAPYWWAMIVTVMSLTATSAQYDFLAITEVLSEGSWYFRGEHQFGTDFHQGSDFLEVTYYGSTPLNLTGCSFVDGKGGIASECFSGLWIHPGESIVLFRVQATRTPTIEKFREWWGGCLSANVQVVPYPVPGFDSASDNVSLYDPKNDLLDRVELGPARPGVSFVNNTNTGDFGAFSTLGQDGACLAATADDIGSPGTASGPLPLRILHEPSSIEVCSGLSAVFTVRACGLPRPKYQWVHNGTNIPGANAAELTIDAPSVASTGEYKVLAYNCFDRLMSSAVTLTMNTNPSLPIIYSGLADVEVFVGETARFTVTVCSFPPPVYQWQSNGVDLVDATNRILTIPDVALETSNTVFRVSISNPFGTTNLSARLLVSLRPKLVITEVMPIPSTNGLNAAQTHMNWFEVSNWGINAVNLKGCRHSDHRILSKAEVVTNDTVLGPGESAIFVEQMTRDAFIRWWGAENLPPNLKVVTYVGYGLSSNLEGLYLWSRGAEADTDSLADVVWATPPVIPPNDLTCPCDCEASPCGVPLKGHSLVFDPDVDCMVSGMASEEGKNGTFRSVESDDLGSPGWTTRTPPRLTSIDLGLSAVALRWTALPGTTNMVQCKSAWADPCWTTLGSNLCASAFRAFTDTTIGKEQQRYYRIVASQ